MIKLPKKEGDYLQEIEEILSSSLSDQEKKEKLSQYHETDIADVLDKLEPEEQSKLHKILGDEFFGDVILHAEDIGDVVENMSAEDAADIIEQMDADDAIDVLEELDDDKREEIVKLMDQEAVEDIKAITQYDEDELGSKMTNNFITILNNDTVTSAMKKVIAQAAENDNVSTIFVLDAEDKLYGELELRDLIIARKDTDLSKIIKTNYPYYLATAKVDDTLPELKEYSLDSYPIVDEELHLIGVITLEDVVEVLNEESGDDYVKLAGITEEEDNDESVVKSVTKRIPWLVVLLVLGLIQSISMSGFEAVVAALPIIIFFQTLVLDMAGNAGTQSLAVTIRLIATQEVEKRKIFKAIFKEIRVGMTNGLILASLSFGVVLLYLYLANKGIRLDTTFEIIDALKGAGIVALALFTAMTLSSFIGTIIPIIFLKLKVDPAEASGPFITTINDVTAMLIYYGLAALLFSIF